MTLKREQLEQIARKHVGRVGAYGSFAWDQAGVLAAMEEAVAMAVERCARHIELIGFDWRDAGNERKWHAAQYLRDAIRAELGKE